jgi:hypothetical protein
MSRVSETQNRIKLLELGLKNAQETLMMAAAQTNHWAYQSERYGWSTHQVLANRALSKKLISEANHLALIGAK